jgi:hypothetical protein
MASVYGGVVVLLVLLALFAHGFSQSLGEAHIGGRYAVFPLFQARALNELTVSWNGMALHFSRSMTPPLEAIETGDGGTDLIFKGDARVHLSADTGTAGSLTLTTSAPAGAAAASAAPALVIPYTMSGVPLAGAADAAMAWKLAGRTFLLSLPAGAEADVAGRTLTVPLRPGALTFTVAGAGAAVAQAAAAPARTVARPATARPSKTKLPEEKSLPTAEQLQQVLGKFADVAWTGWTQARYAASTDQWKLADRSLGISGDIGVALLSESIARGSWAKTLPLWTGAETQQAKRAGEGPGPRAASVYVGGIREWVRSVEGRRAAEAAKARDILAKPDPSLLAIPGLVPVLLDGGSTEAAKAAAAWLATVAPAGLDLPSALALLEDLVDAGERIGLTDALTRALRDLLSKRLYPSVAVADSSVFLLSDPAGHADVLSTVRCGSLLLRAGALLQDSLATALGRGLVASALSLADDAGLLPARLTVAGGRVSARDGVLAPESVYALLPLDRRLPREVALPAAFGEAARMWIGARVATAEGTADAARIVFSYPQGTPYHFAIVGLRPFRQMRLHGIAWHADPDYAKYSDGWFYDASSRTLYMKITGKAEQEEIDFSF